MSSMRGHSRITFFIWLSLIVCFILMILFPVFILVKYSVSDIASINTGGEPIPFLPGKIDFGCYRYLFSDPEFYGVIGNSFVIAFGTVLLSLMMGVPAGYVLGRYKIHGRKLVLIALMSVRLFPDIVSIIPITECFISIGAHNTYWGVILAHTLLALPYVIFITMSAFEAIPLDLEEQASVLGAGVLRTFFKILLPLVAPGLVAASIYTFLLSWDEFVFAYFLLGMGHISTMTLYLNDMLNYAPPQNLLAAISVCLSLPVILFSILLQKYNTEGIISGAVK